MYIQVEVETYADIGELKFGSKSKSVIGAPLIPRQAEPPSSRSLFGCKVLYCENSVEGSNKAAMMSFDFIVE